jgi:ATP-binding cassette subfamily B protein/ATP-binding cassette subfamily C protein
MRIRSKSARHEAAPEPEPDDGYAIPELAAADWMQHAELFANTSFWAVTKRLPAIVREAVSLAGGPARATPPRRSASTSSPG